MIKMSLDKETVKVSPTFPAAPVSLSEQPQLAKSHPLRPKNGLQAPGNSQNPLAAVPTQRIAKRRYSMGVGFKGLAKRRRRANSDSQAEPVLPSHFLLGGNIFDPLNLNSLMDEDVNRATNQETPKCSPLPTRGGDPVEILVPRDITDPLNLKGGAAGAEGGVLLSPMKSRKRHRNRGGAVPARVVPPTTRLTVPVVTRGGSIPVSPLPCELNTAITCRDDVAPPPILPRRHTHPPPGHAHKHGNQGDSRQRRRRRTTSTRSSDAAAMSIVTTATAAQPTKFETPLVGGARANRCGGPRPGSAQTPQRKKDKHRYQHGNHSRYYGYHGSYGDGWEGRVGAEEDPRLRLLEADWFRDKKVLDVGCGAGHMTLAIARRFNPAHILGVELDHRLVHAANQNVRHFLSHDMVEEERRRRRGGTTLLLSSSSSPTGTKRRGTQEEEEKMNEEEQEEKKDVKEEEQEEVKEEEQQEEKKEEQQQEEKKEEQQEEKKEEQQQEEKKEEEQEEKKDVKEEGQEEVKEEEQEVMEEFQRAMSLLSFPLSFRVSRGPLAAPPLLLPPSSSTSSSSSSSSCRFPNNVTFIQGDYVSEREAWPGRGQYDIIMCLGVTKWVQLQSGDGGVVRLFKRAYQSLSPGGLLILEPQPWSRYSHSKRASETTYRNYRSVRLRPEQFTCYLTDSVGFTSYRLITHTGNQRPIYLFHKGAAHRK